MESRATSEVASPAQQEQQPLQHGQHHHPHHQHQHQYKPYYEQRTQQYHKHQHLQCRAHQSKQQQEGKRGHTDDGLQLACDGKSTHSFHRQGSFADKTTGAATQVARKKLFSRSRSTPWSLDENDQSSAVQENGASNQQPEGSAYSSSSPLASTAGDEGFRVGVRLSPLRSYGCFDRSTSINHTDNAQRNTCGFNRRYAACPSTGAGSTIFPSSHTGSSGLSKSSAATNEYETSIPACSSSKGTYLSSHARAFFKKSVSFHCTPDLEPDGIACNSRRDVGNAKPLLCVPAVHSDWKQPGQVWANKGHGSSTVKEARGSCAGEFRQRKPVLSPSATGTQQIVYTGECPPAYFQRTPQHLHNHLHRYVSRRKQHQKMSQQQQMQQQQQLKKQLSLEVIEAAASPERTPAYNLPVELDPAQQELLQEYTPLGQSRSVKHCARPCYEMQCSTARRLRPVALHDSQHQQHYRKQHQQQHSYKQQHQQKQGSEPKAHQTINCLSPAYYPLQPSASSPSLLYCQKRHQMQRGSLTLCEKDMNSYLDPLLQQLLLPAHDKLCVSSQQVYPRSVGSPSLVQQTLTAVPSKFVPDTRENVVNHFSLARQNISPFSSFSAPQSSISFSASSLRSAGESSFCSNDKDEQQGTSLSTCVSSLTPPPLAACFDLPPGGGSATGASSLNYFAIPAPRVAGRSSAVLAKNEEYCVPSPQMSTYKHALADNVRKKQQNDVFCTPKSPLLLPTRPSRAHASPLTQGDNVGGCTSANKTSVAGRIAAISDVAPQGANLACFTYNVAGPLTRDATTASRSVGTAAAVNCDSENDPEGDSRPAQAVSSCANSGRLPNDIGVTPAVSSSIKTVRGGENDATHGRPHTQEGALKSGSGNIVSACGGVAQYAAQGDTVQRPFFFFFPPKDKSFLRPLGAPLVADPRVPTNGGVDNKENDYIARKYEFIFPDYLLALSTPLAAPSEVRTKQTSTAAMLRTRAILSTPDPAASAASSVAVSASGDCSESAVGSAAARVLPNSVAQLDRPGNLRPAAVIQPSTEISDKSSVTTQELERDKREEGNHKPKEQLRRTQNQQPQRREEQTDQQSNTDVDNTGGKSKLAKPSVVVPKEHMSADAVAQSTEQARLLFRRKHAAADTENSMTPYDEEDNVAAQRPMDRGLHNRADACAQGDAWRENLEVDGFGQEGGGIAAQNAEGNEKVARGAASQEQLLHMNQRRTGTGAKKPTAFLREKEQRQLQRKTLAAAAAAGSQRRAQSLPARKLPCPKDKGIAAAGCDRGRKTPGCGADVAPVDATTDYSATERCAKRESEDCEGNFGRGSWDGEEEVLFASALVQADQQRADTEQAVTQTTEQRKAYLACEETAPSDLEAVKTAAYGTQRTSYLLPSKTQATREDKDDKAKETGAELDDAQSEQKGALLQPFCRRHEHTATQGQEIHDHEECGKQAAETASCSSPSNSPATGDKGRGNRANCWPRRNGSSMHYYQVLRLLGRGTFGHVYECLQFDACSGEVCAVVAVKVVKNDEAYTRSALQEIAILHQLHSKSRADSKCTSETPPAARANGEERASSSSSGDAVNGKTDTVGGDSGGLDYCVQFGENLQGQQLQHVKQEGQRKHGDGQQQKRGHGRLPDSDLGEKRVVQLLDNFTYRGHECLVFEILQTDLYQLMKKYRFSGFPLAAVKQVCRELLQGLAHLKRMRVVHCDLKPENILVRFSGPLPVHQQSWQDQSQKDPLLQRQQETSPHQPQHHELHTRQQDCRHSARQLTRDTEENGPQQRSESVNFSRVIAPLRLVLPIGKGSAVSVPAAAPNTPASAENQRIRKNQDSTLVDGGPRHSLADEAAPGGCTASVDIVPLTASAATNTSKATTTAETAAACLPLETCSTLTTLTGSQPPASSKRHSSQGREYLSLSHTCKQTAACCSNAKARLWLPSNSGTEVATYNESFTSSAFTGCSPPVFQNPPLTSTSVAVPWIPPPETSPSAEDSHHCGADSVQNATDGPSLVCKDARAATYNQQVACASACRTVYASLPDTEKTPAEVRNLPTAGGSSEVSTPSATAQKARLSISVKLIDFSSAYYLPSSPQPTSAAAVEVLGQRRARSPAAPYLYAQSRFYGAPEVMLGVHYMEKLDIWAVGCVAAELYSGKPLLPGTSDFDQMRRLVALRGIPPEWMLRLGRRTSSFFARAVRLPQQRRGSDEDTEEKRRLSQQKGAKEDKQHEHQGKQDVLVDQKQQHQGESVRMRQTGQDCKQAVGEKMKKNGGREQECRKKQQSPLCANDGNAGMLGVEKTIQVSSLKSVDQGKSEASLCVRSDRWRALSAVPPGASKRNIHAWWQRALVAVSSRGTSEKKSMQDRDGRRFGLANQQQQAAGPPRQEQQSVCPAQQQQLQKKKDQWTPLAAAPGAHWQQPEVGCHENAAEAYSEQAKQTDTNQGVWGAGAYYQQQATEKANAKGDVPGGNGCLQEIAIKPEPTDEDESDDMYVEVHRNEEEDTLWTASAEDDCMRGRNEKREEFAQDTTCADEARGSCGVERIEWRLKTAQAAGEEIGSQEDTPRESPTLRSLQDLLIMRKQRDQLWRLHTAQQEATPRNIMRPLQLHGDGCWWPSTSEKEFGGKFPMQVRQPKVLEAAGCTSQSQVSGDAKLGIISDAGMDVRIAVTTEGGIQPLANQPGTFTNTAYPQPFILATSAGEKQPAVAAVRLTPSSSAKDAPPGPLRISDVRLQCCGDRPACTPPHADKNSYTLAAGGLSAESHHKGICFSPNRDDSGDKEGTTVTVGVGQEDDKAATKAISKRSNQDNTRSGSQAARKFSLHEPQLQQAPSKGIDKQGMTRQPDAHTPDEKTTIPSRAAAEGSPSSVQSTLSSAAPLVPPKYPATASAVDSSSPAVLLGSPSRRHTGSSQNTGDGARSTLLPPAAAATPAQDPTTAAAPKTLVQAATNTRQSLPERATRFLKKLMKGRTSRPSCQSHPTLLPAENRSPASSSQRASSYEDDCPSLPKEKSPVAPDAPFTTPKSVTTQNDESLENTTFRTTPSNSPVPCSSATSPAPHTPSAASLASSCVATNTPSRCTPISPGAAAAECLHSPKNDHLPPGASFPAQPTDTSSHACFVCSSTDVTSPSSILPTAAGAPPPSSNASDIFSSSSVASGPLPAASSPRMLPVAASLSAQAASPTLHGTAAAATVSSCPTDSSPAPPPLKGTAACLPRLHCSCSVVRRVASSSFPPFPPHDMSLQKFTSTASTAGSTSACSCCSLQHVETAAVGDTAVGANPAGVVRQKQAETETSTRAVAHSTLPDDPARAALEEQAEEERQEQLFLDFLDGLLQVDPFKRFTAEEALRHPFIAEDFADSSDVAAELPAAAAAAILPKTAAAKPVQETALAHPAGSKAKAALGKTAVGQVYVGKTNASAAATGGVAEPVVSASEQHVDVMLPCEEHICPSASELNTASCSSVGGPCFPARVAAAVASEATTHRPTELLPDFLSNPRLHGKSDEKESCISINVVAAHAGTEIYSQGSRESAIDEQYFIWSSMRFKEVLQRLRDDPITLQPATTAAQEQDAEAAKQQEEAEKTARQQGPSNKQIGADHRKEAAVSQGGAAVKLNKQKVGCRLEKHDSSWSTEFLCKKEGFSITAAKSSRGAVQQHLHGITAKASQQECLGTSPVVAEECALIPSGDASRNHINGFVLPSSSSSFSSRDFRPLKEASVKVAVSAVTTAAVGHNSGRHQSDRSRFAWAEEVRQLQDTLLLHHVRNVLEEEALKARHIREQRHLQQRQLNELQELRRKRQQAFLTHQLRSTKRNLACGLRNTSTDA